MLVVSPYARPGYISHTQYEFGSILKFVESIDGLQSLGTTDQRAASMLDCFDFNQAPIPYKPIASEYPIKRFVHERPSLHEVDYE